MIFPGFPGALSFFQVFQIEWEPCNFIIVSKAYYFLKITCYYFKVQSLENKNIKLASNVWVMFYCILNILPQNTYATGPFFMKLRILGDIHKICISGKIFAFHTNTKDILEHLLF